MTSESDSDRELLKSVLDPDVGDINYLLTHIPGTMDRYAEILGLAVEEKADAEAALEAAVTDAYMSIKQLSPLGNRPTEAEMRTRVASSHKVLAAKRRVGKAEGSLARLKGVLDALRTQSFLVRERSQRELVSARNQM